MNYRKTLEGIAQRDFQESLFHLNEQINSLNNLKKKVEEARENRFLNEVGGGPIFPALSQVEEFIKGQALRIKRQEAKIQDCEKKVEELREVLRSKSIDYKIVEGLRDRKFEQFREDKKKLEQKRLDDLITMRFRLEGAQRKKEEKRKKRKG